METAAKIASFSKPIAAMAKTCVNQSFETSLKDGILMERRIFYSTFATVRLFSIFFLLIFSFENRKIKKKE